MAVEVDLNNCEREPIHIPGSIQPHGALLALDESLVVRHASANLKDFLGVDGAGALGQHARSILGGETAEALQAALCSDRVERLNPLHLTIGGKDLLAVAHRHLRFVIVEVEPRVEDEDLRVSWLGGTLAAISSSDSLENLLRATVAEVSHLTAFDRVLAYRFDETGAGQVVAEQRAPDMESYLDLHYPASDIPAQARRLYLLNCLRYIPDARYRPAPLLATPPAANEGPLDLTHASLRSVSPIHVEYLANMGHQASMSISLVVHGRLWGLISCGHRQPHFLPYGIRTACELVGRLVSLQIDAREEVEQRAEREAHAKLTSRIVEGVGSASDVLAGMATRDRELMLLADATGVAVLTGQGWKTAGAVPAVPALDAAVQWFAEHAVDGLAYTHQASVDIPALAPFAAIASGVLAIGLPKPVSNAIFWFRPEVVRTVRWGGDPNKTVGEEQGRLRPRKSFEEWKELVRATSSRWRRAALEAAQDLRRHAIDLDLALQVELERKAVRSRNDLMAVVSHDLRNPLNVAQLSAAQLRRLLQASDGNETPKYAVLNRIDAAVGHMNALVKDLLDLARIESGRFSVSPAPIPLGEIIEECRAFHQPLADRKRIELQVDDRHSRATVIADRERIFQVLTNLFGNALKFTAEGGHVSLEVEERANALELQVSDDGPGIAPEFLPRVFEKYFRGSLHRDGTGLGLFIAKGIVEAHGGKIWIRSTVGTGTTVGFSVLAHRPAHPGL